MKHSAHSAIYHPLLPCDSVALNSVLQDDTADSAQRAARGPTGGATSTPSAIASLPGRPAGPSHSPAEYFLRRFGAIRVATWNAAQLLGGWFSSPAGVTAKRRRLRVLLEMSDVVLLQETRGIPADLDGLPPTHRYWGTFAAPPTGAAGTARGGTVIAIRSDCVDSAAVSASRSSLELARLGLPCVGEQCRCLWRRSTWTPPCRQGAGPRC